ncbi:MAG: PepSY domain-containing protein [Burkholderiales bacterium]|nr:PepSY domain-containing protein [Burkholderiales bacterium]
MTSSRWPRLCLCAAALWFSAACVTSVQADDRHDHDRARAALRAGEVLSLQQVLEKVQHSHPGEVLEVELEREDGRWVYELKLLQSGGRLVRLDVDAKTAEILKSRQRPGPQGKSPGASEPGKRP